MFNLVRNVCCMQNQTKLHQCILNMIRKLLYPLYVCQISHNKLSNPPPPPLSQLRVFAPQVYGFGYNYVPTIFWELKNIYITIELLSHRLN